MSFATPAAPSSGIKWEAHKGALLVVGQPSRAGQAQKRPRAEEVVEQLRRRQHGPHPLEGLTHLVKVAGALAHVVDGDLDPCRAGERAEQLGLDEAPRRVVATEPPPGRAHDLLRLGGPHPQVGDAERHDQVVLQRAAAVAHRLGQDVGHADVALHPGGEQRLGRAERHVGHQVGEHGELDAGLPERGQHPVDVAEEHPVGPDDEHTLVLEREAVGVQQVGGAVERGRLRVRDRRSQDRQARRHGFRVTRSRRRSRRSRGTTPAAVRRRPRADPPSPRTPSRRSSG